MSARLRNLCTNPQLLTGALTMYGCTAQVTGSGSLRLVATGNHTDNRIELPAFDITKYHGQKLLVRVDAVGSGTVAGTAQIYVRFNDTNTTLSGLNVKGSEWRQGRLILTSTVPPETSGATTLTPVLTVPAATGAAVYYKSLLICTLDDWNALGAYKIDYFDGDTRPRKQP